MGIDASKPSSSQIEITLLGPGYGESTVIHFGNNRWGIVDSCIEPGQHEPAALQYLQSIGVDTNTEVVLVVATHWHDDHIKGLSQIIDTCKQARFSCPLIFGKDEFASMVTRVNKNNNSSSKCGSGAQEILNIYALLANGRSPRLASVGNRIFSMHGKETGHGQAVQVWALSPSDYQVDAFLQEIGANLPEAKTTKFRVAPHKPNRAALVNLIEIGQLGILLGADLEQEKDISLGWSAVINNRDALLPKALIYKVAHHGSKSGHHDDIWSELLLGSPFAIITPWNRSKGLPTLDDVQRIASLTPNGYITSNPKQIGSKVSRDPAVEKTIKDTTGGRLRRAQPKFGIIRLRTMDENHTQWSIELSDTAVSLNRLVA